MWLFTPVGFYSVVTAEEFGHSLQVRARQADDLDRLRAEFLPRLGENVSLPGREYPWRAFTTTEDFAACLARLAHAIDYSNFEDEVARRQGVGRAHIYGKVRSACRTIAELPSSSRTHAAGASPRTARRSETSSGLIDIHAAADYLATSERHMRELVAKRRIPFLHVGRLIRFDTKDLDAFKEAGRVEARTGPLAPPRRRR